MKLNKCILGAAAFALASGVFAQTVTFHAGVDYTTWGLTQTRLKTDGESSHTDPSAAYDPDGNMTVDVSVRAANFEFNLGLYFNADGGDEEYIDYSDGGKGTPFYQGNMKVGFFSDQLNVYLGKFENFNAGFIADSVVFKSLQHLGDDEHGQSITNLADASYGQYLTGVMLTPYAVSGLKLFAGFPILPIRGNGIQTNEEYNQWKTLVKKAKLAASYQLPNDMTINAGWRPGTYFDGVDNGGTYATLTDTFTESQFGEGFVQFAAPNLTEGLNAVLSYDIRYRDGSYQTTSNTTKEHTTTAHSVGLAAEFGKLFSENLTLAVEDRLFYADDDYIASDEKLLHDVLGVLVEYDLSGKPVTLGLGVAGMYASDANGTAFADNNGAKIASGNYYCDSSIGMSMNDMATASVTGLSGDATMYLGAYANPYIRFNFENGAVTLGGEICYTRFSNDNVTNTGLSYRIPVGVKFEF